MEYLRYVQTWVWIWGAVSTSTVGVVIWALIARLPGAIVFVLALGAGVLTLLGLETALVVLEKVTQYLRARYVQAVIELCGLRSKGIVLRNRPVTSDAELRAFIADLTAFQADALAAMQGAATRTEIAWFRDLHEWTVTHGVSAYNDEHAVLKATLDEKLRRMHQIAGRLDARIR
jgi:hypothetical protein